MSNDRLLKISGVLFLLYLLIELIRGHFLGFYFDFDTILHIVSIILLALYCLWLNNKKFGNIFYYISLGVYIIRDLWIIILYVTYSYIRLMFLCEIFFMIYLIFIKIKSNKIISFAGIVLLGIYSIGGLLYDEILGVFFSIPLAIMWWSESKGYFIKNKKVINNLENDLEVLKNLYESGKITEENYNKRKSEILKYI